MQLSPLHVAILGRNITAAEGTGEKYHSSWDTLAGVLIQAFPRAQWRRVIKKHETVKDRDTMRKLTDL